MNNRFTIVFRAIFFFSFAAILSVKPVLAETLPTLEEIAQANTEAWAAIETVDMEFAVISESFVEGETLLTTSLQNRWIYSPDKERLIRIYDLGENDSLLSDSLLDEDALREHQATSIDNDILFSGTILPAINPIWQSKVNIAPYLLRYPCGEIDLNTANTLAWLIKNWPTKLDGSHRHEDNTIWRLRVQCPDESPWCGGVMQIEVNENRDFLVQKVIVTGLELGGYLDEESQRTTLEMEIMEFVPVENGNAHFPSGFVSRSFSEPRKADDSPHTVYKEIPTQLVVNGVLPEMAFDFKFEKHEIVTQYDSLSEITAVYLWGDDNRPMQTFASYQELDRWQFRQDISAFVSDYFNLPRIVGRDLGQLTNHVMTIGQHQLLAERQRRQEALRELAPLPIAKNGAEQSPVTGPSQLLSEETPIKSPQTIETTVVVEPAVKEIAPTPAALSKPVP